MLVVLQIRQTHRQPQRLQRRPIAKSPAKAIDQSTNRLRIVRSDDGLGRPAGRPNPNFLLAISRGNGIRPVPVIPNRGHRAIQKGHAFLDRTGTSFSDHSEFSHKRHFGVASPLLRYRKISDRHIALHPMVLAVSRNDLVEDFPMTQ